MSRNRCTVELGPDGRTLWAVPLVEQNAAAAEIERLREQLHLANIDAVGAHAEANELRKHLIKAVALIIRLIDTRRCSASDLRTLNAARAALEAKP